MVTMVMMSMVVSMTLPPIAVEWNVVVTLPVASPPIVANVVGDVESLAVAPFARSIPVIALTKLAAAPAAPLPVPTIAIAIGPIRPSCQVTAHEVSVSSTRSEISVTTTAVVPEALDVISTAVTAVAANLACITTVG
jgi:hypothetical protein